MKCNWNW